MLHAFEGQVGYEFGRVTIDNILLDDEIRAALCLSDGCDAPPARYRVTLEPVDSETRPTH